MGLDRLQRLDHHVLNAVHDRGEIYSDALEVLLELSKVPLAGVLPVIVCSWLAAIGTCILDVVLILFVDRVVRQVDEASISRFLAVRVLLCREPNQALFEKINF